MKKFFVWVPILMAASSMVLAHGPVRQKVVEKIEIDAAPDVVWEKLKNYGDMGWVPAVKSADSENLPATDGKCEENASNAFVWVGKGEELESASAACASRTLTLDNGQTITEAIKKYNGEKMMYSYRISDMSTVNTIKYSGEDVEIKAMPVTNYSASIMVKDNKKGGSQVIWKAGFYRGYMNNNPPPELTEEVAVKAVTDLFQSGLANLKKVSEGK